MKSIESYHQRWLDDEFDHWEMLEEIQKDAYNEALEDVKKHGKAMQVKYESIPYPVFEIDKESIDKLKKQ